MHSNTKVTATIFALENKPSWVGLFNLIRLAIVEYVARYSITGSVYSLENIMKLDYSELDANSFRNWVRIASGIECE